MMRQQAKPEAFAKGLLSYAHSSSVLFTLEDSTERFGWLNLSMTFSLLSATKLRQEVDREMPHLFKLPFYSVLLFFHSQSQKFSSKHCHYCCMPECFVGQANVARFLHCSWTLS